MEKQRERKMSAVILIPLKGKDTDVTLSGKN